MKGKIEKVIDELIANRIISIEMREQYIYSMEFMIERIISISSMVIISIVLKKMIFGGVLILSSMSLKRYTGGYHTNSFKTCYPATMILYIIVLQLGQQLNGYESIISILLLISALMIALLGTVNHPDMNYTDEEYKESKNAARYILILELIIIFSFKQLSIFSNYSTYMSLGIIVCALGIVAAKITKQEV